MAHQILIVDDEPHIVEVVDFALQKAGLETHSAADGQKALTALARTQIDLIILDIGLPGMDGLEVCRKIRATSDTPILFLTAHDEEADRIVGLEIGGDDYVTKPFSPRELTARVKAILKRTAPQTAPTGKDIVHGPFRLSASAHQITFEGAPVPLTALEFALFEVLLARPNQVFSRDQIIENLHGPGHHITDRTIDSHIRNLRAKFSAAGCADAVSTVRGVGFKLAEQEKPR